MKKKGMNEMMNNTRMGVYTYTTESGDESYNFNFRTNLSVAEKLRFVNSVVDLIVDDNCYNSIIRDLIFDYYTIKFFTTVDTEKLDESNAFLNDTEDFLLSTNIVEIVKANALPTLFEELNKAVDKSIEYRTGIHPSPIADSLASLLSTLEKKIDEFDMSSMMGMAQKFVGMTGELTPESLVNAYMNSDTHKNNLIEIEKSKKSKKDKKNEIKIDENLGEAIRTIVKENKAQNDNEK